MEKIDLPNNEAYSEHRKLLSKKAGTTKIVTHFLLNQIHCELVGTLCVDKKGKVEFLPLIDGACQVMPDFVSVLQVGLERNCG